SPRPQQDYADLQAQPGEGGCQCIINHDAKASVQMAVKPADREWLEDVEQAEQHKTQQHPLPTGRCGDHGHPVTDKLVPDDAAVIVRLQICTGFSAQINPQGEGEYQHEQIQAETQLCQQKIEGNGSQCTKGARRIRCCPTAKTKGQEV